MAGRLRPVPVGKSVALGIVTLGIYVWVRSFKISGDLHRMPGGNANWQLFFWLQFIPLAGVVFSFILYFQNNKQANQLRKAYGLQPSYTPFILACIPIVSIVSPFVWAGHYNDVARRT